MNILIKLTSIVALVIAPYLLIFYPSTKVELKETKPTQEVVQPAVQPAPSSGAESQVIK